MPLCVVASYEQGKKLQTLRIQPWLVQQSNTQRVYGESRFLTHDLTVSGWTTV